MITQPTNSIVLIPVTTRSRFAWSANL